MSLRLVQLRCEDGSRCVVAGDESGVGRCVQGVDTTYQLAGLAIEVGASLAVVVNARLGSDSIDLAACQAEGRLLAPIDHPDAAHLHLSGTGLTHLGSAEGRDRMHKVAAGGAVTDSMRMFIMGVEGASPQVQRSASSRNGSTRVMVRICLHQIPRFVLLSLPSMEVRSPRSLVFTL